MSRAALCLGRYAKIPYTFEKTKTRVFCIEELCFFMKENAGLLDLSFFTKELADWIGEQCALPDLAARLRALLKGKDKLETVVSQLLAYTGLYSEKELRELEQLIRLSADVTLPEKQKARADYFLENHRYAMAIEEYRRILSEEPVLIPSFEGRLYHNLGTAQAKLFLFENAAGSFEKAYRLTGEESSLQSFLAAKRLALPEPEYLSFLTEHGEYYEASLKLEEKVVARKQEWTDYRNNSRLASIRSAFFAGEEETCAQMMRQETGRLMEAYRDYVAGR